jgi:hypothetical protein
MKTHKVPLILLLMMVIVSAGSFLPVQVAKASVELAYDDGTAENGWDGDIGIEHAVRFSLKPGWSSAKILIARFFIYSNPDTFRLHIYGSSVTDPALDVTPAGTGWFDVDLSSYNIVVSGDFYISIEYVVPSAPAIGMDTTGPIDLRTCSREPPELLWEISESSDLMIRAVVDPVAIAAVGGVVVPTNKLEILTPYLALAGLLAVVSAVVVVKRRRD